MIRYRLFHTRSFSAFSLPLQGPSSILFHIVQCNQKIQRLTGLGRVADARQVFDSMSHRDSISWNSLITGYTQYGLLHEAQTLFNAFQRKNIRTWTILLSGYAKHGLVDEARLVFESMPERNVVSWNAMISGYVKNGHLKRARELFDQMPERSIASWNSMVTGYCHCGMMSEARELFDQMEERNCVSWMAVVSGYVEISEYREAWNLFLMMLTSGMRPDQALFVVILSAATGLNEVGLVDCLRTVSTKIGYEGNVVVGTAFLNAYTRNGCLDHAVKFFETMPERNEYSWTTMIAALSQCGRLNDAISLYERAAEKGVATRTAMMTAYARNGRLCKARQIFDQIQNPNVVTWNAVVASYAQNGMLEEAKAMFFRIPLRNAASWAAMISGFVKNGQSREALKLFAELHRSGTSINHSSFTSALFACANTGDVGIGRQIHSLTIKTRCQSNSFVGNGLISLYANCKSVEDMSQDFGIMRARDYISGNSLVTGLSENHMLQEAQKVFDKMPKRDVVSWTAIISAYEQAGQVAIAFQLFLEMLARGMKPNELTVTSLLSACGCLGARRLGEQIHVLIHKLGLNACLFMCNSLITMYFRCGSLDGLCTFEEMPEKDLVTWNAVLAGCAQNGLGKEAIEIFERMQAAGFLPNEISFLGLLCACSHAGLVEIGWSYFNSMSQDYGINPLVHHYTCMVDLLGRAGRLNEAESLIENMPVVPDSAIWKALLGACRIHRDAKLGQRVAERLLKMEIQGSGTYVLLSNMYASRGMWEKVQEIRKLMKNNGVTKEPAISWVQIKNKVHYFRIGDKTHKEFEEINSKLHDLNRNFKATGYVPDTNFVLHDVEEEQKQDELLYHSEKLAVVYGIMHTPSGSPIQILKNLRICGDCHSFMKFISKIGPPKIIIRDGNRFHHFQDGYCSCEDYW
ncbi:DYW domain containing protein [Parasponia andersonii]|uniref:DYW domain containing protein n=1 Tax=Parasponia andersonii TaxID=3476 RepID=A0A2P5BS86_PARAD|nr:DYW domain containing protein [Parasponia andersonii]